jgi:hypothetical protein
MSPPRKQVRDKKTGTTAGTASRELVAEKGCRFKVILPVLPVFRTCCQSNAQKNPFAREREKGWGRLDISEILLFLARQEALRLHPVL